MLPNLSYLSQRFSAAAANLLPQAEYEVELGRYRVDVLIREQRLVVELDGQTDHGAWDRCTADRFRDRYFLSRGYRTLRFTSKDLEEPTRCVLQVLEIIQAEKPIPKPDGALFIDWRFLHKKNATWRRQHDATDAPMPSVSRFIREIERVAGMHGNWDVFLYACPGDLAEASIEFDVLRLVNMSSGVAVLHEWQFVEMVAWKLHEHLARTRGNYETVGLVADDAAYPPLFSNGSVLDFLVCCYRSRWLMGDESGIMMPITS